MDTIIIILLHGGKQHEASRKILKYIEKKEIEGITPICIVDNEMKRKIKNSHIKIKEIPSIIIHRDNNIPDVYPATESNIQYILDQLSNI